MSEAVHRNVSWIYQARRVATQANAAGGAIIIDIALATGQVARLIGGRAVSASANNGLSINIVDEDNNAAIFIGTVAAGANRNAQFPSVGQSVAMDNATFTGDVIIPAGAKLSLANTAAGAQNDTLTAAITLELFNLPTVPTWSVARSTNPGDVSLAASTISAANTLTAGRIWT